MYPVAQFCRQALADDCEHTTPPTDPQVAAPLAPSLGRQVLPSIITLSRSGASMSGPKLRGEPCRYASS